MPGERTAAARGTGGRGRGPSSIANVSLHKYRGPGTVTFDKTRLPVPTQGAQVSATATFSDPGEYMLRVQANDESVSKTPTISSRSQSVATDSTGAR